MNKKRPVNLDLSTIKFPIMAIASITHRVTGVVLLAGVLVLLWMLDTSLSSEEGFAAVRETLTLPIAKAVVWAVLAALSFHLVAGLRHLLMDLGIGESLKGGRTGAGLTFAIAFILIILAGAWLW